MQITRLEVKSFKGLNEVFALGKLNHIVGPNGSGKTALLSAIQYTVEGKTPLGDRLEATRLITGLNGCTVGATLDDGTRWTRGLWVDHKAQALSSTLDISGEEGKGLRESEAVLAARVGTFAPMFSLSRFLDLSDDKRRDFVLDLCGHASPVTAGRERTRERLVIEISNELLGPGTVATLLEKEHELAMEVIWPKLGRSQQIAFDAIMGELDFPMGPMGAAEVVAEWLERARKEVNASRRAKDEATQASRKLSEEKATLTVVAMAAEDIKAEIAERRKEREELLGQLENQRGRASSIAAIERELRSYDAQDTACDGDEADLAKQPPPLLADALEASELAAELDKQQEEVPDLQEATDLHKAAVDNVNAARQALDIATREDTRAALGAERFEQDLKSLRSSPWVQLREAIASLLATTGELDWDSTVNLTVFDEWKSIVAIVDAQCDPQAIPRAEAKQVEAIRAAQAAKAKQEECKASLEAAEAAAFTAHAAHTGVWAAAEQTRESNAKLAKAADDARAKCDRIRQDHEQHMMVKQAIATRRQQIADQRLEAQRRLDELKGAGGFVPTDDLDRQVAGLAEEITKAEAVLDAKTRYLALDAELTKCIAAAEQQAVQHTVAKAAVVAVQVVREELMADLVAPLVDRMNKLLDAAAPGKKAFCRLLNEKGRPVFQMGWILDDDTFRPYTAMSGGEQALCGVALAYALVSMANPPLKLLLLEAGEVDVASLTALLQGIEAVAHDLSGVFVATHLVDDVASDEWNVISRLGVSALTAAPQ